MKFPFAGRAERKSAPGLMIALSQLGAARWGGRDGVSLTRDGYLRNAVAYRCVRMIAEGAASIPFVCADETLAKLIAQPNLDESATAFFERLYAELQLTGNAFAERVSVTDDGLPRILFALRPDRMHAVKDAQGWVKGWEYRTGQNTRTIAHENVLHLKLFNPEDDTYGLSPLSAARTALDLHNGGAEWAKALLDNSARPSGALIYGKDGSRMSHDQFDRLN